MSSFGGEEISGLLETKWAARELKFYEETDSTNIQAGCEAINGAPHGTLIVADKQCAGRGRRGRSWESPAGTNIYFSLILKPDFTPDKASMLTLVMAYSVNRAIMELTGLACGIKWPNDIVVNGRKVCGILTEMSVDGTGIRHVIIGVGINVGLQEFLPELADKATCLVKEAGIRISRSRLISRIMGAFEEDYEAFAACGDLRLLLDSYNKMLVNCDAKVRVLDPQGEYEGTARGITKTGELLVETEEGSLVEVYAGEVSVRGIYGYV